MLQEGLALLSRWAHVLSAVALVGGLLFMRLVLLPAADKLAGDEPREALQRSVDATWKKVVAACTALLLVSGFYNFFTVSVPGARNVPQYHGLFGLKFVLALGVFLLASALVGRAPAFQSLRAARKRWLIITTLLAVTVVLLGGLLHNLRVG